VIIVASVVGEALGDLFVWAWFEVNMLYIHSEQSMLYARGPWFSFVMLTNCYHKERKILMDGGKKAGNSEFLVFNKIREGMLLLFV
jgi:hypothetical protein